MSFKKIMNLRMLRSLGVFAVLVMAGLSAYQLKGDPYCCCSQDQCIGGDNSVCCSHPSHPYPTTDKDCCKGVTKDMTGNYPQDMYTNNKCNNPYAESNNGGWCHGIQPPLKTKRH